MNKRILAAFSFICITGSTYLTAQTFNISTIAGNGTSAFSGDGGLATSAEISAPQQAFPDDSGNVYIADASNNRLRKVATTGKIYTAAGTGTAGYSGDGAAAILAELDYVTGVVKDSAGNIYVSDFYNNRIREIAPNGKINTIAGDGIGSYNGDGIKAVSAEISHPVALCLDKKHNLYFADEFNGRIRKIDTAGIITTVAGNGLTGFSGDGAAATAAELSSACGIAIDDSDNIYIADQSNQRIRKVSNKTGFIYTIAGNGTASYSGDGGVATLAELSGPQGVAIDKQGNVYVADYWNNRVRMINTSGKINTIAGTGTGSFSGDGGIGTSAELFHPIGVSVDSMGNVYIADQANARIRKLTPNPTGIEQLMGNIHDVIVYPNPSNGVFTFLTKGNIVVTIEIYNVLGEAIYTINSTGKDQYNINLGNQPKGIYVYKVTNNAGKLIKTGKLVIE